MKVIYVTVRFPAPSETFAGLDVLTLSRSGVDVGVLAMRPPLEGHDRMMRERGLGDILVEPATPATVLRGLATAFRHPDSALSLLGMIAAHTWKRPRNLAAAMALFLSAMRCYEHIRKAAPDVVHLFWGHFPALVGHLVARNHPEIVLSHFLGAYDLEYGFGPSAPVARAADVVWTHALANQPRIEALGVASEKIRVAHRGVEVGNGVAPDTGGDRVLRRVVSAGRLVAVKCFDDALHAFARVYERFPDATFVIAGDGPERGRLQELAVTLGLRDSVEFCGQLQQSALFKIFKRSDVFLFLSQSPSERLPNSAKEAAARGCVSVTTRTPGIEELFTEGIDAFIVPGADVARAADRVIELFDDPDMHRRMAAAATERVASSFDVESTMATYTRVWRELAKSRRGADRVGEN